LQAKRNKRIELLLEIERIEIEHGQKEICLFEEVYSQTNAEDMVSKVRQSILEDIDEDNK